jgi:hypothetical protein
MTTDTDQLTIEEAVVKISEIIDRDVPLIPPKQVEVVLQKIINDLLGILKRVDLSSPLRSVVRDLIAYHRDLRDYPA